MPQAISTELNIDNLTKIVRDKVRKSLIEIIPKDKIDELVKVEANKFFTEKTPSPYNSSSQDLRSDFNVMLSDTVKGYAPYETKAKRALAELEK